MRISDWSSDVCSSDLHVERIGAGVEAGIASQHFAVVFVGLADFVLEAAALHVLVERLVGGDDFGQHIDRRGSLVAIGLVHLLSPVGWFDLGDKTTPCSRQRKGFVYVK